MPNPPRNNFPPHTLTMTRFAIISVLSVVAGTAATASADLLVNPGFELNPSTGETTEPIGWTDGNVSNVNQKLPRSGSNALELSSFGFAYQQFAAVEGDEFVGTAWAANSALDPLASGQAITITIEWRDANEDLIDFASTAVVDDQGATDAYVFGSVSDTAPQDTAFVRFNVQRTGFGTTGSGFVDDANFDLVVVPEPSTSLGAVAGVSVLLLRRRRS